MSSLQTQDERNGIFKNRVTYLMESLQKLQGQTENAKYDKSLMLFKEISQLSNHLEQTHITKGQQFKEIIKNIVSIEKEISEQKIQCAKYRQLISRSIKTLEREFNKRIEKLETDRLQRQIALNSFVDQEIVKVVSKCKQFNNEDFLFDEQKLKLDALKKEVMSYFMSFTLKIRNMKEQINENISLYKKIIFEQILDQQSKDISEIQSFLKQVQQEISAKIHKLSQNRQKFQQNVILIIQKIVDRFK